MYNLEFLGVIMLCRSSVCCWFLEHLLLIEFILIFTLVKRIYVLISFFAQKCMQHMCMYT